MNSDLLTSWTRAPKINKICNQISSSTLDRSTLRTWGLLPMWSSSKLSITWDSKSTNSKNRKLLNELIHKIQVLSSIKITKPLSEKFFNPKLQKLMQNRLLRVIEKNRYLQLFLQWPQIKSKIYKVKFWNLWLLQMRMKLV